MATPAGGAVATAPRGCAGIAAGVLRGSGLAAVAGAGARTGVVVAGGCSQVTSKAAASPREIHGDMRRTNRSRCNRAGGMMPANVAARGRSVKSRARVAGIGGCSRTARPVYNAAPPVDSAVDRAQWQTRGASSQ